MAEDFTFARAVDVPWDDESWLLGRLLLHAASGRAMTTAAAAILLTYALLTPIRRSDKTISAGWARDSRLRAA